ncbi:MAG: AbrB/MazE/SpoVT family DNA-binding domain-containing protein [Anaerolineae bacterium]
MRTYPVRLRGRGQITVPQTVRDDLDVSEGDILTLFQVGDVILLTPKQPQVPRLADKIADLMEAEDVSLADLLAGLEEEREAMWRERQGNA